jgi:hypothetical protein
MVSEEFRHLDTNIVLALTKARSDFNTTSIGFSGNSINYAKELAVLYAFFKWEEPLYWENHKKQLTPAELSDVVAASSSSRGPTSLRKSSGTAINMLFIDMAKQNLPSLRYTKAFADGGVPAPTKKKFSVNLPGINDSSFLAQTTPPSSAPGGQPRSFHNSGAGRRDDPAISPSSASEPEPGPAPAPAPAAELGGTRSWSSFLSSTAASATAAATAAVVTANTAANSAMANFNENKAAASAPSERPSLTRKLTARFW